MPLWDGLGKLACQRLNLEYDTIAPMDAIDEYCDEIGKFHFVKLLRECLHIKHARPGRAHRAFAGLRLKEVMTTNFALIFNEC